MTHKQFFQLEAGNLVRDYKTQYLNEGGGSDNKPRFFDDVEELVKDVVKDGKFTLMNAQFVIARLAGFRTWNELGKASETMLELGRLLLENRKEFFRKDWENHLKNFERTSKNFGFAITEELLLNEFKTRFLPENSVYRRSKRENFGFTHKPQPAPKIALHVAFHEAYKKAVENGEFAQVVEWCRKRLLPYMTRKTINRKHSSAKLKHFCGNEIGLNVNDGTMIMALRELGVKGAQNAINDPYGYCYPLDESFFMSAPPLDYKSAFKRIFNTHPQLEMVEFNKYLMEGDYAVYEYKRGHLDKAQYGEEYGPFFPIGTTITTELYFNKKVSEGLTLRVYAEFKAIMEWLTDDSVRSHIPTGMKCPKCKKENFGLLPINVAQHLGVAGYGQRPQYCSDCGYRNFDARKEKARMMNTAYLDEFAATMEKPPLTAEEQALFDKLQQS